MHKYQRLQDILIKFPQEHAHKKAEIESIILQTNYNNAVQNSQSLLLVLYQYYLWTGAWPKMRQAKKSVASFKLRKGMDIGVSQNLSGGRLKEFLAVFLLNIVNVSSSSGGYASRPNQAEIKFSKQGQANIGITNVENLKSFYLDKEEGHHSLLSSYPTFGVSITFNLPTSRVKSQTNLREQRIRNAMILSQYQLPIDKLRLAS